jgi:predicted ribosome quality control (RQC) complex YloA/Tae2 family protein
LHEFQGYQIWVGKNNKSNDQMLKMSQKNDLWLHAKDVAGSHVIIKKKGAQFPQAIIQYAATLAAKNSKAKTQQVVPVIVVARKFVSKPKNAAPGEVSLQKEEIVDAFIGES